MKTEIWKEIPGYEDRYQVSNLGRIWSVYHRRILTGKLTGKGYLSITLSKNGEKHRFYIHRLVAQCFIPCVNSDIYEVNHKDLNKENNRVSNLEWVTRAENFEHAYRHGKVDYRRPKRCDNKSGIVGVCAHCGGYQATINLNRQRIYIGWYKQFEDAVDARLDAERKASFYANN